MTELEFLQNYWWFLISVLAAALVFMLFVQGGQTMLFGSRSEDERQLMVNSLGRKWELGFTSLVVFGGAFFASFPLYYSTSFGGAYWLWTAILLSFVIQATAYEFRRKKGNLYGTCFYDILLLVNGVAGSVLLGAAVGMMFFGAPFTVTKTNLAMGTDPVISVWAPTHGLEVMADWRCLLLGFAVFFLGRTNAALYFLNNINAGIPFRKKIQRAAALNGILFALLFVAFACILFTTTGLRHDAHTGMQPVEYLYFRNLTGLWGWGIALAVGVIAVLGAIAWGAVKGSSKAIWPAGAGVALVIVSLFAAAGYNATAYLPSTTDAASSLTLANSSSSLFTLKVMAWVSLLIPVVIGYIAVVWRKMNARPLDITDISPDAHQY